MDRATQSSENTHMHSHCSEPASATTIHCSWVAPAEYEVSQERGGSDDDRNDHHHHHDLGELIIEAYEKLPEIIRKQLNLEELIAMLAKRKEEHQYSKSKIKITTTSRGAHGALKELFTKLEKFKVRTIIVDETGTEEQKNRS